MAAAKTLILFFFLSLMNPMFAQNSVDTLNAFDDNGKTPLLLAITNNDLSVAQQLLTAGADVNLKEQQQLQGNPLMYAASMGNIAMIKLLIAQGANINAVDKNHDSVLNWAAFSGRAQVVDYLLENGADLSLRSKHGDAVDVVYRLWHSDTLAQVFRNHLQKLEDSKAIQLVEAVRNGDYSTTKKILAANASANTKDVLGIPLLQIAAQNNDQQLVGLLLQFGANVNVLNRVGQTPLTWAARSGHFDIVQQLLKAGANASLAGTTYRLAPLIGAAVDGDIAIGKLLLANGADINTADVINQASALHWAMFYQNTAFAKWLIEYGADFETKILDSTYTGYTLAEAYAYEELILTMDSLRSTNNPLVGSWKVEAIHYEYTDTTYIVDEVDYGRFLFTPNKYVVLYNPLMNERTPFENLSKPSDTETIKAFRSIVFNSGSYELKKDIITNTPDIAKVPGFEGGKQYYRISQNDKHLTLTLFDETYPSGKKPEWFGHLNIQFFLRRE